MKFLFLNVKILNQSFFTENCLGASFDGAAVMSGHLNGVQAKLKKRVNHAVFTHCKSHNLSLSIMGM